MVLSAAGRTAEPEAADQRSLRSSPLLHFRHAAQGKERMELTPVLAPREPGQPGTQVRIAQPVIRLGRDPGCDVVISEATVSRRHAEVKWDGHELVVEDLGSSGGTFVNDVRVQHAVVQPGDVLRLGPRTEFRVGTEVVSTPLEIVAEKTGGEEGVKHLQMLLDVARALNAATVLEEVVQIVLQSAVRLVRADRGCLILIENDGSRRAVGWHPPTWERPRGLSSSPFEGDQGAPRCPPASSPSTTMVARSGDGGRRAARRDRRPMVAPRTPSWLRWRSSAAFCGESEGREAVRA
jgi:hypothetical protein